MSTRTSAIAAATVLVLTGGTAAACDHDEYPRELSPGWTKSQCFYDESQTCWVPPATEPQRRNADNSDHPR